MAYTQIESTLRLEMDWALAPLTKFGNSNCNVIVLQIVGHVERGKQER